MKTPKRRKFPRRSLQPKYDKEYKDGWRIIRVAGDTVIATHSPSGLKIVKGGDGKPLKNVNDAKRMVNFLRNTYSLTPEQWMSILMKVQP
jgi:hypothetical protein